MSTNTLKVKNLQRASKVEFNSTYGLLLVEVRKAKGGTIYEVYIDGKYTGLNRVAADLAWELIGEYLGVPVEQEIKHEKVIKKAGQSKWK